MSIKTGRAVNFHQRVKFDGSLGSLVGGPGKNTQTQIDGGSVQSINGRLQIQSKIGVRVQRPSDVDQSTGKVGVDSPIATLVGIGQSGASDGGFEAAVIELGTLRSQTDFDIAKTVAISQLSKGHRQKLVPARQSAHTSIAVVSLNAPAKFVVRDELHDLGKNGLSLIHTGSPRTGF
jgi:hypothetical protein